MHGHALITLPLADLPHLVALWLWPFCRIAGLVALAPVFGNAGVPLRVRLAVALALTVVIAPIAGPVPRVDPLSVAGVLVTATQFLIGVALGFALQLVFATLTLAGQQISTLMGLGFAVVNDPQSGVQVAAVGQFYYLLATLVYLGLNGHLVAIAVLAHSFVTLPIGASLGAPALLHLVRGAGWIFSAAVVLALPASAALLLVNLAFGVMSRAAPQLNILSVGFPVSVLFGLLVMLYTLPGILGNLGGLFRHSFSMARVLVGGAP